MSDDKYLIFNLKTGAFLDEVSRKEKPEDVLKKAHEKHIGGPIPAMSFGVATVGCGDLCLMK